MNNRQDPAHLGSLIPILQTILTDRSPLVVGSAVAVFNDLCPAHLDLLHASYRHICASLSDADEWGQIAIMQTLSRYVRANFTDPLEKNISLDPDLLKLLSPAERCLQSRNPAVCMAATRLIFNLAPPSYYPKCTFPLLRILHQSSEIQSVALHDILVLVQSKPVCVSKPPFLSHSKTDAISVGRSSSQTISVTFT